MSFGRRQSIEGNASKKSLEQGRRRLPQLFSRIAGFGQERIIKLVHEFASNDRQIADTENQEGGRHVSAVVIKRAHRFPMIVHPGFRPIVSDLLLASAASESQARHHSSGNAATAAERDQEPALGGGIAPAILETLNGRQPAAAHRRLLENLLIDMTKQRLDLLAGFRFAFSQLMSESRDFGVFAFHFGLILQVFAGSGRMIEGFGVSRYGIPLEQIQLTVKLVGDPKWSRRNRGPLAPRHLPP